MILAEDEVGLGEDHAGIMVLEHGPEPGTPLADVLPIRDHVLDVTPTVNRVDLLSMVGLAREVAALLDGELHPPAPDDPAIVDLESVEVAIEDFHGCPRYIGRVPRRRDRPVAPMASSRLYLADMRSISNVVDVTNYVMHVWGSPLHAFDRSKLAGGRIVVRRARRGEELRTLDGTLRRLVPEDLMITDGEHRSRSPRSWEARRARSRRARTSCCSKRRTSSRSGFSARPSDSGSGQPVPTAGRRVDPYLAENAAVLASRMIVDLAGARMTGHVDVHDGLPERPVVRLRPERASFVIGLGVAPDEQRHPGFGFEVSNDWDAAAARARHARST